MEAIYDHGHMLLPDDLVRQTGFAFCFGAVDSLIPSQSFDIKRGLLQVLTKAPRGGGYFAALIATYCVAKHNMILHRRKEDLWNEFVPGASAGGLCNMRKGMSVAARRACFWEGVFVCLEGACLGVIKYVDKLEDDSRRRKNSSIEEKIRKEVEMEKLKVRSPKDV